MNPSVFSISAMIRRPMFTCVLHLTWTHLFQKMIQQNFYRLKDFYHWILYPAQPCALVQHSLQHWEVNFRRGEQCCWLIADDREHSCVWMNTGERFYSVWCLCSPWSTAQINLEILFSTVMLRTEEENEGGKPLRPAERPAMLLIWMLLSLSVSQGPFSTWPQQPDSKPTHTLCAKGNGSHSTVYMSAFERQIFQF